MSMIGGEGTDLAIYEYGLRQARLRLLQARLRPSPEVATFQACSLA